MGRLLIQFPGTNTTKALSETLSKNVIIVDEDLHQLHLHDGVTPGGHVIGGGGGAQVVKSIDAEIVGNLTVAANGDVSGFSTNDYLIYPGDFNMTTANSFEIVFAFTTDTSVIGVNPCNIFGPRDLLSSTTRKAYLGLQINLGKVRMYTQDPSIFNPDNIMGMTTLSPNTKYYVKATYDGTNYTLYLSTDGSTWITEGTTPATIVPSVVPLGYAIAQLRSNGITVSAIHMSECYIKKDGILVWQGLDCPGLNQRASNLHEVIEFQIPTSTNNYTWYRKYADGWVEQGGIITETSTVAQKSIVFPVEMANSNYNLQVTLITDTNGNSPTYYAVGARTKSATGFTCYMAANITKDWKVCGMAA